MSARPERRVRMRRDYDGSTSVGAKAQGFVAVTAASVNLVSGFLTTDRMLKTFKREGGK